jgi:predicted Holliday junction resolvase-like endonuclease
MDRDYIMIVIGIAIGLIGWFLKREINRVDRHIHSIKERMRESEMDQCVNDTRDKERWKWIEKNMEDRRQDIRKLFDMVQELVCRRKD